MFRARLTEKYREPSGAEGSFYRTGLKNIIHMVHSADSLDEALIPIKDSIISLLGAERITIYAVDRRNREIFSKIKTGAVPKEIRVPISNHSVVGYVASTGTPISINDAYNENELMAIYPDLKFDHSWDVRTGYHTRQILAQPLMYQKSLVGVIQIINKKSGGHISSEDRRRIQEIAEILGVAFFNDQKKMIKYKNKFDYLVRHNIFSRDDLNKATEEAREHNCDMAELLMEEYKISKTLIGKSLSAFFKVKFFNYNDSRIPSREILKYIKMKNPVKFMRYNNWVPLKKENERILIVCEDPSDENKVSDIRLLLRDVQFDFMVGLRSDIVKLIDKLIFNETKPIDAIDSETSCNKIEPHAETDEDENGSIAVKIVNLMILDAYNKGASDIHVETYPDRDDTIIRFRQDGECFLYKEVPADFKRALVARIKIMSNLNIAERRLPQDGKIQLKNGLKTIELRVATIPTYGGNEDVVMRILAAQEPLPLDELNLSPMNKNYFIKTVIKPYGIFLVVGPTGSGKTTTLHSVLGYINTPEKKIWTAEDPVEITQKGLRQVQVHPDIEFTFAAALRAFLRADPDVIMIGEMRDHETAKMGVEASLTGHLVFSTLHTNSAPETITRLIDLGVDPFNFSDALLGILSQRLVKTLCPFCKERYSPAKNEVDSLAKEYGEDRWSEILEIVETITMYSPKGCPKCNNSGFKGRTGLHEILITNKEIKHLIQEKATVDEIREAAIKNGMITLKQDGILKVLKGDTTIEKVRSVCNA